MNICQIRDHDVADGPGVRVSVYVSGCTFNCPGCHNKDAQDFNYGKKYDMTDEADIMNGLYKHYITGLSILGGEPLHPKNIGEVLELCRLVRMKFHHEKTIWLWTGYTAEELLSLLEEFETKHRLAVSDHVKALHELLYITDVLVEGRYEEDKKDLRLAFRGSRNQRIINSHALLDKRIEIVTV